MNQFLNSNITACQCNSELGQTYTCNSVTYCSCQSRTGYDSPCSCDSVSYCDCQSRTMSYSCSCNQRQSVVCTCQSYTVVSCNCQSRSGCGCHGRIGVGGAGDCVNYVGGDCTCNSRAVPSQCTSNITYQYDSVDSTAPTCGCNTVSSTNCPSRTGGSYIDCECNTRSSGCTSVVSCPSNYIDRF